MEVSQDWKRTTATGRGLELLLTINLINCQLAPDVESPAAGTPQFLFLLRLSSVCLWLRKQTPGSARADAVVEQKGKTPQKNISRQPCKKRPRARSSFHHLLF